MAVRERERERERDASLLSLPKHAIGVCESVLQAIDLDCPPSKK
jgi:hypothetical protein